MLLASSAGSIGMAMPLHPVAELANPVNRPGTMVALGADQAQRPHEVMWALHRSSREQKESVGAPYAAPAGAHSHARPTTGMAEVARWAGG
jgi:hypothetical protein